MADIVLPQLGETVTEGTITRWFKNVGESVAEDEPLFEISTDKVDSEVPSPAAGVLTEILAAEGATVPVGAILARLAPAGTVPAPTAAPAPVAAPEPAPQPPPVAPPEPVPPPPAAVPESPSDVDDEAGAHAVADGLLLSPVVRRLIAEHDLDPRSMTGTGVGGRITRGDVESVIQHAAARPAAPVPASAERPARAAATVAPAPARAAAPDPVQAPTSVVGGPGDQHIAFSTIRRRTAEHMVMSKHTSPHVLTAVEVDYERVDHVRRAHRERFKAEEGFSLTYLPFIARALCDALRDFPQLNASVEADELVVHSRINLAVAVDLDFNGLLAPVVHDVASKRLRAIAREVRDLADRAHAKKLVPDDLAGGTFTITNAGSYGTMMQFPIINQPQVAILSTDGVKRRPVVVTDSFGNESIAIHSVGVLAMAWDHRAFDGAYAAAFLDRLRRIIEDHDWAAEL